MYYTAFLDLATTRSVGYSAGNIGWDKVMLWGQFYELEQYQIQELWIHIQALDRAYLDHMRELAKSGS